MSWFNLNVNESLNTLKGQITNVSNVVHDVFTEGALEEQNTASGSGESVTTGAATGDDSILIGLETANKKIDELNWLCEVKDDEINKLRKQIETFNSATTAAAISTQKSKVDQHGSQQQHSSLEDSWFWESEKSPSSVSSKENDTPPGVPFESTANLTTISLAAADVEHDTHTISSSNDNIRIVERLRRSLDEKDAEIRQLVDENLSLNDKIKQLHRESIEQDQQIEQLDQQHSEAMERMLSIKNELQDKCDRLQNDLKTLRIDQVEANLKFDHFHKDHSALLTANEELLQRFDALEQHFNSVNEEKCLLDAKVNELQIDLGAKATEITELNALIEEKEAHSRDGSDKFEMIDIEKDKLSNSSEINRLTTELDEINERLSILNDIKDQYDLNVLKLGSVVDEKNKLEEQVAKLKVTNSNLMEEVQVTREAVEKLEILQQNLDEINSEKEQNELALQEDELVLQREFDQLKADKEKLATELESTKTSQDEQIIALEAKCADLETKLEQMYTVHENLQADYGESEKQLKKLQVTYDALKVQASDLESHLVEENMMSQKQVIDLQSALNSKNAESLKKAPTMDAVTFDELKALISKNLNYVSSPTNDSLQLYLDAFFRSIKETYKHLEDIEENRDDLMKQFEAVSTEKVNLQHERKTLKADLHHYEAEVAELMKNNEILLVELENAKTGKLETISEHNEDSILRLETQLEDCSKLNRSLEEEYENMQRKFEEKEEEKYELLEKVADLEQQLETQAKLCQQTKTQLENLELERTNVQLQLDQMRTDDSKLELQKSFEEKFRSQNDEIADLTKQLENLNVDHAALVRKIESLQDEKQKLLHELEQLRQSKQTDSEKVAQLQQMCEHLKAELSQNQSKNTDQLQEQETELAAMKKTIAELKKQISTNEQIKSQSLAELQQHMETMTKEKEELIAAVQSKHTENVQYHLKIQELNQMLTTLQQTIATQNQQHSAPCTTCEQYNERLNAAHEEIGKLTDQVTFLKEKADILTQNLLIEQTNQKLLQQEKVELSEEKLTLTKDLNRLREHLIEMENGHTSEMIELQNTLEETRQEMAAMQEEARKSNTAYTSASIRANQHTETIQAQYVVLQQQKEDLSNKLSAAEDRESKNQAALINLQCALEQFQKDKERDVEALTNRIRSELSEEIEKRQKLVNEIHSLQAQLEESKAGLLAAARISDLLEISQVTNQAIKEELRKTQDKLHAAEQKLHETETNQADRVDKSLLKNLLIGYIVAPNNDKQQILKLISSVLDFNQQESDKVGLNRTHTGWLNSILHGASNTTRNENYNKDGLVEAFVKFLENESQPRSESDNAPTLLNIVHPTNTSTVNAEGATLTASIESEENRPMAPVQPILLSDAMLQTFITPRNSSSILKDILSDS